ncbi:hypothetical protein Bca4012_067180 [Brassica carinata]
MLLSPRLGRTVGDGIPNRDDHWRDKFFLSLSLIRFQSGISTSTEFPVNGLKILVRSLLYSREFHYRICLNQSTYLVGLFGSAPMSPEPRGMIKVLPRGLPQWLAVNAARILAAYALSLGQGRAPPI